MRAPTTRDYTASQAAERLGVARQTVNYLIRANRLPARRVATPDGQFVYLIPPGAVDDYARRMAGRGKRGPKPTRQ